MTIGSFLLILLGLIVGVIGTALLMAYLAREFFYDLTGTRPKKRK